MILALQVIGILIAVLVAIAALLLLTLAALTRRRMTANERKYKHIRNKLKQHGKI